ncbi:MAG TPA: NAD(+) diphosphatase [Bacteroidales bacterium]|nr:NAD(+) diphosphatase [Bacteroidales bacterium]
MIQDIYPHFLNNRFTEAAIATNDNDFIFVFRNDKILLRQTGDELEIPTKKYFKGTLESAVYLFSLDNSRCYLAGDSVLPEDESFVFYEMTFFRTARQKEIAWASLVAHQIMHWYDQNQFCGKCGSSMSHKTDERALVCTECKNTVYPRISPAIIVAIICGNKILLAKGVNFRGGFYSLIAGYADIGESLEETVVREVKEEVGIDVFNIRYYKSQPWPLSGSMMIGFIAEADDTRPITIDEKEIAGAAWFERGSLPQHSPSEISIAGEMIERFESGEL